MLFDSEVHVLAENIPREHRQREVNTPKKGTSENFSNIISVRIVVTKSEKLVEIYLEQPLTFFIYVFMCESDV
jgi:hypothetical protein